MRRIEARPAVPVVPVESEPRPLRGLAPHGVGTARASGSADALGVPGAYGRAATALLGRHSVHRAHSRYGDKAAWYLPLALTADALAGVPVAALLGSAAEPHAVLFGLLTTAAWTTVRAARGRYASAALGESRCRRGVPADWLVLLGVLAVVRTALGDTGGPGRALAALLLAPVLTSAAATATRLHLLAVRRTARSVRRVVVVAEPAAADHVVNHLAGRTGHPYAVVGVVPVGAARLGCGAPEAGRLASVPPTGSAEDARRVLAAVRDCRGELVLVAPGPRLAADRLRRLSWALHDAGVPLAVLPGLVDVGVRRVQLESPAGLAMLHIAPPARDGAQVAVKTAVDRAGAALLLVLLAPVFAVLAGAIRLTSRGPAFHRQTRYGRAGTPFTMWKFRTMVADAEARKVELERAGGNEHDGLMFKMRRDPRITRVGRVLRRCSLDELPQLVNVLRGEMSLVGPRPPLPDEVARYDEVALRRLAVKPGITGLWQVSGRSDLSWDETLALDLGYVDNWSLAGDVEVMARTVRAVVDGRGAY